MLWKWNRNPGEGVSSGEERAKVVQIESKKAEIKNKFLGCLKALKENIVYVYLKIHFYYICVCIFKWSYPAQGCRALSQHDRLSNKSSSAKHRKLSFSCFFSELEDKSLFLKTPYTLDKSHRGTEQELFCKSPPWCVAFTVLGGAM